MKITLENKKHFMWVIWATIALIIILIVISILTIIYFSKDEAIEDDSHLKGLALYIWRYPELTGNDDIYFILLPKSNRGRTEDEIFDLDIATTQLSDINLLLKEYDDTEVTVNVVERMDSTNKEEETVDFGEIDDIVDQIEFPNRQDDLSTFTDDNELMHIDEQINRLLDFICSSPLESSSPKDYMMKHQTECDEILSYEHKGLPSLVTILDKRQYDLKENIAYSLCTGILVEYMPFSNIMDAELALFTHEAIIATSEWLENCP